MQAGSIDSSEPSSNPSSSVSSKHGVEIGKVLPLIGDRVSVL